MFHIHHVQPCLKLKTLIKDLAAIAGYCFLYKLQHLRKKVNASSQNFMSNTRIRTTADGHAKSEYQLL